MAYFARNFQRNYFLNTLKNDTILNTARLAKKKIDPFVEPRANKSSANININPLKKDSFAERFKNFIIREIIQLALCLGLGGYIVYLLIKKKRESLNLDEMNVI